MSSYKHILVGLDLSTESQQVVDRVKFLFANSDTKISLCHILEPLAFTYGGDIPVDLSDVQTQLQQQATERLDILGQQLQVATEDQHIILGHPAQEMHRMAKSEDIDLIIVGSHGRHGLALIFGSTSNSVLHGANCDVLAVRISE
ncbi:universal stress protein [Porticoccaceae bacterium]|jgi:universal stress protein A|nr:universal stress protein [Porticoccaceae bacterium]MDC0133764.1 universal stress protein [Porticoccaceae bacterium]MDC1476524.1 universal stress protein [Porticoccaceae bacterium]CAI8308621.1 MAG: Universal stress protein A [SAR92 bacterium MED-G29]|tara:strand:- start:10332 stop:10766 length:435 start_codon:yes stop_codon:yes gene_type:complete